ncbi:uncharacterized protein PV07_12489 [Cladophialophora immunda]|uniref:Extracellular membrane protein CFEM domain-containing protein n=1 Tax=Cladophialophora immunda TaxID=569365 RepID=A0A0D2BUS9_9EURO|nr:uncharacterized protein PV07_12489 [Cladophialophora immunda]KIW22170.1 hypothetical protein PV07_12489 [Cladophialophora immunda]
MGDHIRIAPSALANPHDGDQLHTRQASTDTCLPPSLLSVIPACAVDCVQQFASHNYPGATCANTSDIEYLCTQSNISGLTIGEGSVQCVVSACTGQDQEDLDVYGVCNSIPDAQPRTARTITATIIGSSTTTSSTMENLPATIGNPTSTEEVSTIVMATDTPTRMIATSAASPTSGGLSSVTDTPTNTMMGQTTSGSAGSDGTSGAVAVPEQVTPRSGLTTPQIAGITVGGAATVVIVVGLILLQIWIRKRRRERRRSQRRSRLVESSPPVNPQSFEKKTPPNFGNAGSTLTVPSTQGRFYAPQQPTEEKRRSFWRKSIRPEEIGIAVSPKMPGEHSPVSASSQQSFSHLLPKAPPGVLWPAQLDVEATRERRRYTQRPVSDATEFDDEPETRPQEPERVFVDNQPFILEKPPLSKRPRGPPPNLRLPALPESPAKSAGQTARIPLTPTYDNGNVDLSSPQTNSQSPTTSQLALPVAEHKLPASSMYANRSVLRKKPPARLPLRVINTPLEEPLIRPRNPPMPPQLAPPPPSVNRRTIAVSRSLDRQSSASSVYTEIEEDTTPEEANKQLGIKTNPATTSIVPLDIHDISPVQESPIKDLRYPRVPRSAAISRQADRPAQLRSSFNLSPTSAFVPISTSTLRPTKDQLVRAELSFMQTDTTSSDGYLSDEIIEFPIPPVSKVHRKNLGELRSNPSSGNKGPPLPALSPSLNEVMSASTRTVNIMVPQRSPSSKARLTPSKSSSGDLYLTVEI